MGFIATALETRAEKLPPRGVQRLDDPRYIFGSYLPDNHTGEELSEGEVVGWPAMMQALRIIGWSLGQMPLQVYEREAQGARKLTPADNHPLQPLLQEAPHPDITPFELKSGIGVNAAFRGDSYCHVARTAGERIEYILPMESARMRVERVNGRRWYYYEDNGREHVLPADQVLQVSGFGDGGIMGFAIQQMAATTLAKGVVMDRFGARVFKNGASGNAIVESTQPFKFKDQAAEKEFFDKLADKLSGPKNWHKVAGLPYGMTIKTLGITAREAQLIEGLVYQVQDIARLTGVPPSLLMDNSHNTFTNSEQQFLQFIKMGLGGWIVNIEERMRLTLLSPDERKRYTIKFNADALLRTSLKERYEAYRIAVGVPFMSRNEARDLEDMEPVEGGDLISDPLNMSNPGGNPDFTDEGDGATTPPQDGDSDTRNLSCPCSDCATRTESNTREYRNAGRTGYITAERRAEIRNSIRERTALRRAFRRQIQRDAARLIKGEIRELNKLLDKHLGERSEADFLKALEAYYEGDTARGFKTAARNIMGDVLRSFAESIAAAVGNELDQDAPDLSEFVDAYIGSFIARTSGSHLGQLRKLIEEAKDDLEAAIRKRLEEWETEPASQAEKIGSRESVQLGEAVARTAMASLGVTRITWIANAGACPLCEEMDGMIVGIESTFIEASDQVDPNDDDVTPVTVQTDINNPPLHQGCECGLAAA